MNLDYLIEYITKEGDEFIVHAESGKILGRHKSKKKALKQLRAIEMSKHGLI